MAADRSLLIRVGYVLATIALGVAAYALGTNVVAGRGSTEPAPSPSASAAVDSDFVEFKDELAGIKLSIPKNWKRLEDNSKSPLADVPVDDVSHVRLVAGPSSTERLLLVRVKPLPAEIIVPQNITVEELGAIQGQLDKFVEGPDVRIAEKKPTNVKGLLAWRYLYNFKDSATGREGSHIHYFIFDGAKINILVFEALPADEMEALVPTFDKILDSFESTTRIVPRPGVSLPPVPSN